jgi:hypothetical protein
MVGPNDVTEVMFSIPRRLRSSRGSELSFLSLPRSRANRPCDLVVLGERCYASGSRVTSEKELGPSEHCACSPCGDWDSATSGLGRIVNLEALRHTISRAGNSVCVTVEQVQQLRQLFLWRLVRCNGNGWLD